MSNSPIHSILKEDSGVENIVRLYACLNDWYDNIHQEKRGVRACERVYNIRESGLVPLSQRYFEFIAEVNDTEFTSEAEDILSEWADEYRPDYIEESDEQDWEKWNRSLTRIHLDPEIRIASFAHKTSIAVNNHTINAYGIERVSDELETEFEELWSDWWYRMDDLYWERRYRIAKTILKEIESGIIDSEDKKWERRKKQYPDFPTGTIFGGEKQY